MPMSQSRLISLNNYYHINKSYKCATSRAADYHKLRIILGFSKLKFWVCFYLYKPDHNILAMYCVLLQFQFVTSMTRLNM